MLRDTSAVVSGAAILLLAYLLFLIFKPFAVALVFAAVVAVVFHLSSAKIEDRTSRRLLLQRIFVMQPTEDRCRSDTIVLRKPMTPCR